MKNENRVSELNELNGVFILNITTNTGMSTTIVYDKRPTVSILFEALCSIPLNSISSEHQEQLTLPLEELLEGKILQEYDVYKTITLNEVEITKI